MRGEEQVGPIPDAYHLHELPGHDWVTCKGCAALRVYDWHYFYCRRLGDQTKADAYGMFGGWKRLRDIVYNEERPVPCGLANRSDDHAR